MKHMTMDWELMYIQGDEVHLSFGAAQDEEFHFTISFSPHEAAEDEDAGFRLTHHRYLEDDESESWVTEGLLRQSERGWTIVKLSVEPGRTGPDTPRPATAVTGGVLRSLRLGVIHSALAALADGLSERSEYLTYSEFLEMGSSTVAERLEGLPPPSARPARGRPRRTEEQLRQFAVDFLACNGNYRATSKKTGKPVETVKTWLKAARRDGWIAPGMPGIKGAAVPGPRLLAARTGP